MYIDNFHGLKIKEYYTYNNDNKLEKKSRRISDRDLRQGNIIISSISVYEINLKNRIRFYA